MKLEVATHPKCAACPAVTRYRDELGGPPIASNRAKSLMTFRRPVKAPPGPEDGGEQ